MFAVRRYLNIRCMNLTKTTYNRTVTSLYVGISHNQHSSILQITTNAIEVLTNIETGKEL